MDKKKTTFQVMQEEIEKQKNKPILSKVGDYLGEKGKQLKSITESEYDLGKEVKDRWENFQRLMAIKKAQSTAGEKKSGKGDKDVRSKDINRTQNKTLKEFAKGAGFFKNKEDSED